MSGQEDTWGSCWVLVTGASRGLGAAICEGVAPLLGEGSRMVGVARTAGGLASTEGLVKKANAKVTFIPVVLDLGVASKAEMEAALKSSFGGEGLPQPSRVLLFHNAGTLGNLKYLKDLVDQQHVQQYFNLNICSVVTLNALLINLVQSLTPSSTIEVINISSLAALQPFKSWGLYCAGKAGRDMLFKVLATEEPNVSVLNYAPGPLDNDMQNAARTETADDELRSMFSSMKNEGKLLSCSTSVSKLIDILKAKKFKSGDHVDFYDE
ncbi:sepiapterin reductase-like [Penaeus japonicus]|uniref:sepiapterin reductase-like n=1 Tax=Penaeus japonicus TaxID=27405 RepID=UPI001C715BB1|nr:sepiapterin reductase-like [Penaeus japonicus]XP_042886207.1 sepiapterin reductase-like [Penaeus japonicus]